MTGKSLVLYQSVAVTISIAIRSRSETLDRTKMSRKEVEIKVSISLYLRIDIAMIISIYCAVCVGQTQYAPRCILCQIVIVFRSRALVA